MASLLSSRRLAPTICEILAFARGYGCRQRRGREAAAAGYRDYRDRYREMAKTLGFEGHIAWSEAMP
jgi:hypothetical protein